MKRFSLIQEDFHRCYICNKITGIEIHEVFFGRNRQNSIEDGCCLGLCKEHHTGNGGVHMDRDLDLILKERMQLAWMKKYNLKEEDFIKRYRRSYIHRY